MLSYAHALNRTELSKYLKRRYPYEHKDHVSVFNVFPTFIKCVPPGPCAST